jgi:hypothetical protein
VPALLPCVAPTLPLSEPLCSGKRLPGVAVELFQWDMHRSGSRNREQRLVALREQARRLPQLRRPTAVRMYSSSTAATAGAPQRTDTTTLATAAAGGPVRASLRVDDEHESLLVRIVGAVASRARRTSTSSQTAAGVLALPLEDIIDVYAPSLLSPAASDP